MTFTDALIHILIKLGILPDWEPLIQALDKIAAYDRGIKPSTPKTETGKPWRCDCGEWNNDFEKRCSECHKERLEP